MQLILNKNKIPFATWKQILEAGVDIILISEHSFFLCQKNDPQPFSSAAQNYEASNSPGRARKALEEVFKKYKHASYNQKVEMVTDVILQNHMASTS
ncbi:hypothetical protein L210DRAFT_953882 [Boletus edulis BED1]|uniref:Uncharacterized protein n=1 Tax=Boletus edulis BED1 TaxID=1328754 RepID=A0AAD4BAY7_BOLED|nr:hypothetical protein L210DRAFT_953882 [Boletus edulis BED1]